MSDIRKIPVAVLKKLPHPMNLIKIIPDKIEFTNSEFKKAGVDVRQVLQF